MPQNTITDQEALALAAVLALGVVILYLLIWHGLRLLRYTANKTAPHVRELSVWRDHPVRAWLQSRFPRTYALIARRLNPRAFSGMPLTLIVLAATYLALLFGGLIEDVLEAEGIVEVDTAIFTTIAPLRNEWLVLFFRWVTEFGSMPTLSAVAIVATGFLWADRRTSYIAPLWLTVVGSHITTWGGKFIFARPRPDFILDVTAYSPSFPSGHATGAVAVYGIVAYAILRDLPSNRSRFEVAFWTCLLIALVAGSRVFLNVHYPSDVAAGLLVGGFWLLAGIALAETTRTVTQEKPPPQQLFGAMKGTFSVAPGTDLTTPTSELTNARASEVRDKT